MYPPGFHLELTRARKEELERNIQRLQLLAQIEGRVPDRDTMLRSFLYGLGRLLERSGCRLQRAARYVPAD